MSLTDIGRLAGCTRINVHYKLKKYGIETRSKADARTIALDKGKIRTSKPSKNGHKEIVFKKIRYNEDFFKIWSAEMAYVLGLIYTDGNLHIRKDRSGYELGILSFAQKDKELVEKFIKLIDCNATIRFKEKKILENTVAGELYYFNIGNNDLAQDLLQLGVVPQKSLELGFPQVPNKFLRHFIRGVFDGDGSVYLDSDGRIRVKFLSGSREFIDQLNNHLIQNGFSKRNISGGTKSTPNAFFIRYNSSEEVLQLYHFLYDSVPDSQYYSRKKKIFSNFFKL